MDNVINFNKYKEIEKKKVEDLAYEKYGVIKAGEDIYLYPETSFVTNSEDMYVFLEELGADVEELLEEEATNEIRNIVTMRNQKVAILKLNNDDKNSCDDENMVSFDILNTSNNKSFILSTMMEDEELNRKILTGIIAGVIKLVDVDVTMYLQYNFREIENIIMN